MDKIVKDKRILIAIIVVVILLVGGGVFVLSSQKSASTKQMTETSSGDTQQVLNMKMSDLGVTFTFRDDKKAAKFVVGKSDGIQAIEYIMSYDAIPANPEEGGDSGTVNQAVFGTLPNDKGSNPWETEYREFGTCSSGHCRYDKVMSDIKLTLKITQDNGKVYQAEQSYPVE